MKSENSNRTAEFLARSVEGADSAQIAESIAATWLSVEVALTPIIGQRGVVALFNRSLHLTAQTHAWLAVARGGIRTEMDVAALKPLFAVQTRAVAAAGAGLLLRTFYELLTTLIGPSLTERLLRSVLATFMSDPTAQDISP
jgi:hypothetical protein